MSVSSSTQQGQAASGADSVRNQIVVVTGASSGLGLETAKQLAIQGAEVVMICRSHDRGEKARAHIAHVATGKQPVLMLADLSVQADIRRVGDEVKNRYDHVDVLINNAGGAFSSREHSTDGIELTWATNHLAPFLLTDLLLPLLVAAPAGRVVTVASEIYSKKLDLENLQGEHKYSYFGAYRTSKLGNVLFTRELARRTAGSGITAVAVSPGPARTNFGGGGPGGVMGVVTRVMRHTPIFRRANEAAEGIVWAATTSELNGGSGGLYMRRKQLVLKGAAADESLAGEIWRISESQSGIDPERSAVAVVSKRSRNDG
jgi:NAD(P)-dependent dehydrogenase (short-subunit alcohol dehydrogenase family)